MEKSKMQKGTIKVLWNLHATLVRNKNIQKLYTVPENSKSYLKAQFNLENLNIIHTYVPQKNLLWPVWH